MGAIIFGGNFMVTGQFSRGQFSSGTFFRGEIGRGNFSRGQLSGGQFSLEAIVWIPFYEDDSTSALETFGEDQ